MFQLRATRNIQSSRLLPVMVFIHWGGFFTGYSSSDYLGPEYFMDKNVVLVTFNYRLGILGKWVNDKKNIVDTIDSTDKMK